MYIIYTLLFKILGVCSLAKASRARQFNPLNPPGVGWRSCAVGHAWSVMRGRAWSVVRGRARSVVRGRAWSCAVGRARSCRSARFAASTAVARTNEQHLITH